MRKSEFLTQLHRDDILVKGTRVPLELVVHAFHDGQTPEDFVRTYPSVTLPQAYGVIAYYLSHQDEVDRYVARVEAWRRRRRGRRSGREPEVVRRIKAMQATGRAKALHRG